MRQVEFDDYLEMVIEFGYISMFAAAFPLAAAISLVYNLVEMKSDLLKLCFALRRPPSVRSRDIGTWGNVLMVQVRTSHSWCALLAVPCMLCAPGTSAPGVTC
jgi:Calcium-activated chloride channel